MVAKIIDGKLISNEIKKNIKYEIQNRLHIGILPPGLAVIIVGTDPASLIYIENKKIACREVGINSYQFSFPYHVKEKTLLTLIEKLNLDNKIDGILVQLPLPSHINEHKIIENIFSKKDVDGFHPYNLGLLAQRRPYLRPCTSKGIITLLKKTLKNDISGFHAVVIGASNLVGRPMSLEFLLEKCTSTVCHKFSHNIKNIAKKADILVSAVGIPRIITADWIKPDAIVIDVGINRLANGKLIGDVDYYPVSRKASWITPVPGGVGPITVATLLENTLFASKKLKK